MTTRGLVSVLYVEVRNTDFVVQIANVIEENGE